MSIPQQLAAWLAETVSAYWGSVISTFGIYGDLIVLACLIGWYLDEEGEDTEEAAP